MSALSKQEVADRQQAPAMFLTPQELEALTGKEKPSAQARELDHMGIPYRARRDKTLAVLWIHVRTIQGHPAPDDRLPPPDPVLDLDDL